MGIPVSQMKKRMATISKRQKLQQEILLSELGKNSVMTAACQKAGIPRSTIYRWIKDNPTLTESIENARSEGRDIVNDMAESVIIKKVREENLHAAKYWLSHNNERYRPWRNLYSGINNYQEVQSMKEKLKGFFEDVFKRRQK